MTAKHAINRISVFRLEATLTLTETRCLCSFRQKSDFTQPIGISMSTVSVIVLYNIVEDAPIYWFCGLRTLRCWRLDLTANKYIWPRSCLLVRLCHFRTSFANQFLICERENVAGPEWGRRFTNLDGPIVFSPPIKHASGPPLIFTPLRPTNLGCSRVLFLITFLYFSFQLPFVQPQCALLPQVRDLPDLLSQRRSCCLTWFLIAHSNFVATGFGNWLPQRLSDGSSKTAISWAKSEKPTTASKSVSSSLSAIQTLHTPNFVLWTISWSTSSTWTIFQTTWTIGERDRSQTKSSTPSTIPTHGVLHCELAKWPESTSSTPPFSFLNLSSDTSWHIP